MYSFLIVNEDITERRDMLLQLQNIGMECEIYEADSSACVTDMVNMHEIDIIFLNLNLDTDEAVLYVDNLIRTYKQLRVVVISDRMDFQCVLRALRIGVSDYLVMPVLAEELECAVNRIVSGMEAVKNQNNINSRSREYVMEHILYLAVNGSDMKEIEEYSDGAIDLDFLNEYNCMMLIDFNNYFFGRKGNDFKVDFLAAVKSDAAYLNLNQQQSIIFCKGRDEDYIRKAEQIIDEIFNKFGEKCFVAVSGIFEGFDGIFTAMEELDSLMENKFYHKAGEVFFTKPAAESGEESAGVGNVCAAGDIAEDIVQTDDDTIMKQMKQAIKIKDIQALRTHFEKFSSKYRNKTNFSQVYIKFLFANLLKDFYENIPNTDETELNEEIDILYKAVDFNTVIEIVNKNIDKLEDAFAKNPQMIHKEIEIVKQYIFEHYGEEISVEKLGEMVYMAPSYLSSIFKKETGQNLSKFIKEYRMERAKDMLENTMSKILDISVTCGYANVSYFCSSFREYFGVSPQKYRENGEENLHNNTENYDLKA